MLLVLLFLSWISSVIKKIFLFLIIFTLIAFASALYFKSDLYIILFIFSVFILLFGFLIYLMWSKLKDDDSESLKEETKQLKRISKNKFFPFIGTSSRLSKLFKIAMFFYALIVLLIVAMKFLDISYDKIENILIWTGLIIVFIFILISYYYRDK